MKQVIDTWGTIDVLCNVAGITDNLRMSNVTPLVHMTDTSSPERLTDTNNESLERIMGINFHGPLYLMRHVIPHFLAKPGSVQGEGYSTVLPYKGSIVNVGSIASFKGAAAGALYTASKHALLGLSRNTSWMYNRDGIRTNIVFPGGVATNIMANSGFEGADPVGGALVAPAHAIMPAVCMPDDIARAIVFLAGATATNGAELVVDQAWTVA